MKNVLTFHARQVARGVLGVARLGTGTANARKVLRGDGTWGASWYSLTVATTIVHNPVDTTVYYFGQPGLAVTTTADARRVYIPLGGTIVAAGIVANAVTTTGTNESWKLAIRLNNTTSTPIDTLTTATAYRYFGNTGLTISVNAGEYFEIEATPPAWVTNPLGVIYHGHVIVAAS